MKATIPLLQLAAFSAAFVMPEESIFQELEIETRHARHDTQQRLAEAFHDLEDIFDVTVHRAYDLYDGAKAYLTETGDELSHHLQDGFFDAQAWVESVAEEAKDEIESFSEDDFFPFDGPPHRGPPHRGPPGRGGHGPHKPCKTVYELIAESKYTTKLAKLISEFPDLVDALNGTSANFTVFAPTDKAFDKIPSHAPKPSKKQLESLLAYHVSPYFYPAGRILGVRTIPSLLKSSELGKGRAQRLSTTIGLGGLRVNFYSKVIAANIFGSNGVIHGIDSILLPPPKILKIIDLLPSTFSTLELGLTKTGLLEGFNETRSAGSTLFAPTNGAFRKLGPRINAFLFSSAGEKYLKALLEYHVVPGRTLYSDAYYGPTSNSSVDSRPPHGPPRARLHFDLPTLLKDRSLSVDVRRFGRLIEIKINGFSRVAVADGVAKDGVIHIVPSVLIPPKEGATEESEMWWDGESEMSMEEFTQRLDPLVNVRDDL